MYEIFGGCAVIVEPVRSRPRQAKQPVPGRMNTNYYRQLQAASTAVRLIFCAGRAEESESQLQSVGNECLTQENVSTVELLANEAQSLSVPHTVL